MKTSKSPQIALTEDSFWESVNILITKPHVVNKRLWGSKIWNKWYCSANNDSLPWDLSITCGVFEDAVTNENVERQLSHILKQLNLCAGSNAESIVEVILIELIPKAYTDKQAYQVACLQRKKCKVTFYNITPVNFEQNLCPDFTYSIELRDKEAVLNVFGGENTKSYTWLTNTLLPQFIKWGTESLTSKNKANICSESLALISKTKYYDKYNELKLKYGKEMVKIWPECTDPSKFVYEDVAIATYLLILWEQDDNKSKTFVDLGCGNGLLVYILAQEGHSGVGLDVRKRNIWDMYPSNVALQEKTITPSDVSFYEVDWVIGNHSDELTPWIPVIAAKSSYKCNFFLLPCCAYNFDGSKYQRKNSYKSQYIDYLEYIQQLCVKCGFKVDTDRLKIPSTKRICIVSRGRNYLQDEHSMYCEKIDDLINSGSNLTQDIVKDFKPREAVERVRNCTQIDKNVIDTIVNCITKYLLQDCNEADTCWSIGKTADINQLVQLIPKDLLNILKSECGGLQTLMKNNHHIFKVQNGKVELRYPKTIEEVNSNTKKRKPNQSNINIQVKPCWFYNNHPQGCPLQDNKCSFLHVKC